MCARGHDPARVTVKRYEKRGHLYEQPQCMDCLNLGARLRYARKKTLRTLATKPWRCA